MTLLLILCLIANGVQMAFLLTAAIWQIYSRIRWKSEPLTAEQISVWCFVFVPVWLSLMVTVPLALK